MTTLTYPEREPLDRAHDIKSRLAIAGGARSKSEVHPGFLEALEAGCVESRTHVEQMAMTMSRLCAHAFPALTLGTQITSKGVQGT
jgi:hypothetical protein